MTPHPHTRIIAIETTDSIKSRARKINYRSEQDANGSWSNPFARKISRGKTTTPAPPDEESPEEVNSRIFTSSDGLEPECLEPDMSGADWVAALDVDSDNMDAINRRRHNAIPQESASACSSSEALSQTRNPVSHPLSYQLAAIISPSWFRIINSCLFILVPIGFAVYYCNLNILAIFFINFLAIFPISVIQSQAEDELAARFTFTFEDRLGEIVAGLVNQTIA